MLKSFSNILDDDKVLNKKYYIGKLKSNKQVTNIRSNKGSFDFIQLINKWDKIVGDFLAEKTRPLKIKNGVLYILTNHPSFSQHLSFISDEIIQKVVTYYPSLRQSINKIYFKNSTEQQFKKIKESQETTKSNDSQNHKYNPDYKIKYKNAYLKFKNVEDDEIKEMLISIYIQNFL
jgi:hypothetical protein